MPLLTTSHGLSSWLRGIALAALMVTACREATAPALNILVIDAEGGYRVPLDSVLVVVQGPKPDTAQRRVWGNSGATVVIGDLAPGSYAVALVGFVDSTVEQFGLRDNVQVVSGRNTPTPVPFPPFRPQLERVTGDQTTSTRTVHWQRVRHATGYLVEWDTDSTFANATTAAVDKTVLQKTITFGTGGRYAIRVRAFHDQFVGPADGAASDSILVDVPPPGSPALTFTVHPSNVVVGSVITPAVQVELRDSQTDTLITTTTPVTISIAANPAGGTLGGALTANAVNGVATFGGLVIDAAGMGYTLAAAAGGATPDTSAAFDVSGPVTPTLSITTQPSDVIVDSVIAPAVLVELRDSKADTLLTAPTTVTLALGANPGSAGLGGTVTATTAGGVATFDDLTIDAAGTGYTLVATAPGAAPDTSTTFEAFVPTLMFQVQPIDVPLLGIIPVLQVAFQDPGGNTLTTMSGDITISVGSGPVGGVLAGMTTVAAVNGIATFAALSLNEPGVYTLVAAAAGLVPVASQPFTVGP